MVLISQLWKNVTFSIPILKRSLTRVIIITWATKITLSPVSNQVILLVNAVAEIKIHTSKMW